MVKISNLNFFAGTCVKHLVKCTCRNLNDIVTIDTAVGGGGGGRGAFKAAIVKFPKKTGSDRVKEHSKTIQFSLLDDLTLRYKMSCCAVSKRWLIEILNLQVK